MEQLELNPKTNTLSSKSNNLDVHPVTKTEKTKQNEISNKEKKSKRSKANPPMVEIKKSEP